MKKNFLIVLIIFFAAGLFTQSNIAGINTKPRSIKAVSKKTTSNANNITNKIKNLINQKAAKGQLMPNKGALTIEKLKSMLQKSSKSVMQNKIPFKDANPYHPAVGYDNDGWFWDSDWAASYPVDFHLTQSTPLTYSEMADIPVPVFGGTTLNYGIDLTSTPSFFGSHIINDNLYPLLNPFDFLPLEIAFDHTTHNLYVLYMNDSEPPCRECLAQKGLPDYGPGFYLASFNVSILSFIPPFNSAPQLINMVKIYNAPGYNLGNWDHLYMGLACSRSGQLYTIDYTDKKLSSINKTSGLVSAGPVIDVPLYDPSSDINYFIDGELLNLEFDLSNNKLYLLDAFVELADISGLNKNTRVKAVKKREGDPPPVDNFATELYEINTTTGDADLLTHGTPHSVLWDNESGVNENHFISGFQIPACGILLINPLLDYSVTLGGEIYPIQWFGLNVNFSKVEYSTDNGNSWVLIADRVIPEIIENNNWGISTYLWKVPHGLPSRILIKVSNSEDNLYWDSHPLYIEDLTVVSPNGGENWITNSTQTIQWFFNMPILPAGAELNKNASEAGKTGLIKNDLLKGYNETVNIYYQAIGSEEGILIASNISTVNGLNNYQWYTGGLSAGQYKIIVEYNGAPGKALDGTAARSGYGWYDESDNYFYVFSPPLNGKYILTSPNGGEVWTSGTVHTIAWRKSIAIVPGTIILQLSTDNGKTWSDINNNPLAGTLKYNWLIPTTPKINSTLCLVRMINGITKAEFDRSNFVFTISSPPAQSEAANYPNPFNPSTKIAFGLEKSSFTSLKVYNSIGQQVAELVNRQLEAGTHEFGFNATKLPSGVYYYNLTRDGSSEIHKMLLLK